MECPKCNGRGYITNKRYYNMSPSLAWEHGIKPMRTCGNCKGSGFIIGNIKDIVDRLKCAVNGVTITPEEAKEMLDCIIKN